MQGNMTLATNVQARRPPETVFLLRPHQMRTCTSTAFETQRYRLIVTTDTNHWEVVDAGNESGLSQDGANGANWHYWPQKLNLQRSSSTIRRSCWMRVRTMNHPAVHNDAYDRMTGRPMERRGHDSPDWMLYTSCERMFVRSSYESCEV